MRLGAAPAEGRRRRRQRHGRPDGRAAAGEPRARADRDLLDARRQLPRPRAQPAAAGEPAASSSSACARRGADLGIAWDGDADRCFFIDETGALRRRRLPHGAARRVAARARRPGEAILYDVRASRAVPDTVDGAPAARRTSTASATPSSRRACARRARCSAARSPATTTSATSTAPTRARSRRCSCSSCCAASGKRMSELLAPYRARYFISGEINSEVADPLAKIEEIAERYSDAAPETPRRHLDRLRGLALQRAPVEHRAAAAPVPRVARLRRGHGTAARRGARVDPLVSDGPSVSDGGRARAAGARAARAGRRGGDPSPGDPHAVHGGPRQRVPDRGLAADARRLRAELGEGARRARAGARRARPHASRTSSCSIVTHQHIDHFGLASILARRSGAEVAALDRAGPLPGELRPRDRPRRRLRART